MEMVGLKNIGSVVEIAVGRKMGGAIVEAVEKLGLGLAELKISYRKINGLIPKIKFDPYSSENLVVKYPKLHKSYELSKQHFWDDTKVLDELIRKYGKPKIPEEDREAILKIFSIIYYGEVVAMLTASQLVDMVPDLDAKKVLSAQVIEEAKHVTAYQKYLSMLGEIPEIDPSTRAILDDVMMTSSPVLKVVGLHLLTETVAYYLFTAIRESYPEPVLRGILKYIARDEAKHVGFAKKYLPELANRISPPHQVFVLIKNIEWTLLLVSAFLRLAPYGERLGIDIPLWFDRATEDLFRVSYDIARRIKYSKLVIPEPVARKIKNFLLNVIREQSSPKQLKKIEAGGL